MFYVIFILRRWPKWIRQLSTLTLSPRPIALTYDLVYNYFSPTRRQVVVTTRIFFLFWKIIVVVKTVCDIEKDPYAFGKNKSRIFTKLTQPWCSCILTAQRSLSFSYFKLSDFATININLNKIRSQNFHELVTIYMYTRLFFLLLKQSFFRIQEHIS